MKITDFKVLRANRAVYCKIYTDEGIVGLGESGVWGFLEASAQAMITMSEYLIGKDPLDIEHHWQYLYRFSHFRGAAVMGAMSAIDIALYDIAGKYFHVPVYRLLGGKCRDKVRVYNHTAGRTEEELVENAMKGVEQGYTALGHLNPYLDEPRTEPFKDGNAALLYKAERRIAKVREAVGEDIDLCLELHRRLVLQFSFRQDWNLIIRCFWKIRSGRIILTRWDMLLHSAVSRSQLGNGSIPTMNLKCC